MSGSAIGENELPFEKRKFLEKKYKSLFYSTARDQDIERSKKYWKERLDDEKEALKTLKASGKTIFSPEVSRAAVSKRIAFLQLLEIRLRSLKLPGLGFRPFLFLEDTERYLSGARSRATGQFHKLMGVINGEYEKMSPDLLSRTVSDGAENNPKLQKEIFVKAIRKVRDAQRQVDSNGLKQVPENLLYLPNEGRFIYKEELDKAIEAHVAAWKAKKGKKQVSMTEALEVRKNHLKELSDWNPQQKDFLSDKKVQNITRLQGKIPYLDYNLEGNASGITSFLKKNKRFVEYVLTHGCLDRVETKNLEDLLDLHSYVKDKGNALFSSNNEKEKLEKLEKLDGILNRKLLTYLSDLEGNKDLKEMQREVEFLTEVISLYEVLITVKNTLTFNSTFSSTRTLSKMEVVIGDAKTPQAKANAKAREAKAKAREANTQEAKAWEASAKAWQTIAKAQETIAKAQKPSFLSALFSFGSTVTPKAQKWIFSIPSFVPQAAGSQIFVTDSEGNKYQCLEQIGDGNCLYRTIAHALTKKRPSKKNKANASHVLLRKAVCAKIYSDIQTDENYKSVLSAVLYPPDNRFRDKLTARSKSEGRVIWGDEIDIVAIENLFQIKLDIYEQEDGDLKLTKRGLPSDYDEGRPVVKVRRSGPEGQKHYDLLVDPNEVDQKGNLITTDRVPFDLSQVWRDRNKDDLPAGEDDLFDGKVIDQKYLAGVISNRKVERKSIDLSKMENSVKKTTLRSSFQGTNIIYKNRITPLRQVKSDSDSNLAGGGGQNQF